MRWSSLFQIAVLCTEAFGSPTLRHAVHEKRSTVPARWQKRGRLDTDAVLPMRIALSQQNLHRAEEFIMEVADPTSPRFGQHWTSKQVAEMFAPSMESVTAVTEWLKSVGISSDRVKQSQSLGWLAFNATVAEVESILRTTYYTYEHVSGQPHIACDSYSLPEHVREHIDFITPTVHFDARVSTRPKDYKRHKRQESAIGHTVVNGVGKSVGQPGSGFKPKPGSIVSIANVIEELTECDTYITPDCLRALYKFPPDFPSSSKNSYGIVEYTPEAYLQSDLDMFFKQFQPPLVGKPPITDSIDGGYQQYEEESFDYNGEPDLDLQYGMALVYPQNVTLYQVGDIIEGGSFNNFLDAIDGSYCTYDGGDDPTQDAIYPDPYGGYEGPENCGGFGATNVISTSYGYNEADLTPFYEERQCNEYMKLGLQGVTILYSSGDYGVAGGQCIDPVTKQYNNGSSGIFNPSFPGTCPYVTSVGATEVPPGGSVLEPEVAANDIIYSGGGFSNVFPMPSYQSSAVQSYLSKYPPPYTSAQYNNSGTTRAYPDVSANGVNYVVAVDGTFQLVYGTSCSSPTFGSVVTLINGARLNAGKGPVGFMNPTLYANSYALQDVTQGDNPGCGTNGFSAEPGWDPVTGLGTPNFALLLALYLSLP